MWAKSGRPKWADRSASGIGRAVPALMVDVATLRDSVLGENAGQDGTNDRNHGDDSSQKGTDDGDQLTHFACLHLGFLPTGFPGECRGCCADR